MTYSNEKEVLKLIKNTDTYKNEEMMLSNLEKLEDIGVESSSEQINYFIENQKKWLFVIQIDNVKYIEKFIFSAFLVQRLCRIVVKN